MSDTRKNKGLQPGARPPAPAQLNRSRIAEIQHLRRGVKPEPRPADDKSRPADIVAREAALETATRIAAEFIAQESLERAKLAAEATRAQFDLTREKGERQAAAVDAEFRLAAAYRDLADVRDGAAATRKSLARERRIRAVAGIVAAVLIGATVIYRSMPGIPTLPGSPPAPRSPSRTARLLPESQGASYSSEVRFTEGLDSLNYALASAAGGKPEDAIRAVRTTAGPAVCPFVWRDGQASLTFNADTSLSSLPNAFFRCADAVSQLP